MQGRALVLFIRVSQSCPRRATGQNVTRVFAIRTSCYEVREAPRRSLS